MRKIFLTALSAVLCLNFTVCASAEEFEVSTAVETAVPAVIDVFETDERAPVEGGLVPTVIDDTIEPPAFTFAEENYTGALPVDEENSGADVPDVTYDTGETVTVYFDMGELYQAWYENGEYEYNYPDYVCGVWTETGDMSELVVAVTKDEAGEAGKEEILSLIENDESVKFTYQSYSYKELRQAQDEIVHFMGDESGIYGLGVDETENKLRADIDMSNPNAEATVQKLLAQYGDMLVFEAGNGVSFDCQSESIIGTGGYDMGAGYTEETGGLLGTGINADGGASYTPAVTEEELTSVTAISVATEKTDSFPIFAVCGAAVIVLGAVVLFAVNRARAKQTTAGILTEGGRLTAGDTEIIVAESREEPQRDILSAVMDEIEK